MRTTRPLKVFACVVLGMNAWFALRFALGSTRTVWVLSAILGAWMPLFAARMFRYVCVEGDREDGLAAAWMVRAMGLQSTLAWGVGMNDWLRGPPGLPSGWDPDLGGPFVLLGFAVPVYATLRSAAWFRGLEHRLRGAHPTAGVARDHGVAVAPFRGAVLRRRGSEVLRPGRGVRVVLGAGVAALCVPAVPAALVLAVGAGALGLLAARDGRVLRATVPAVAVLALGVVARWAVLGDVTVVGAVMALPWVALASLLVALAACDLRTRGRIGEAPPRAVRWSAPVSTPPGA